MGMLKTLTMVEINTLLAAPFSQALYFSEKMYPLIPMGMAAASVAVAAHRGSRLNTE